MTKQLAIIKITPITKGKSTLIKASTNNLPKPFHPKIYSTKIDDILTNLFKNYALANLKTIFRKVLN